MNSVFNKLQEFQDICNLVDQPKQDYQMVNMAYIIFQKCPIFKDSLIRWNRRVQENSYNDFKNFMRQEYNELAKVGGLTVGSTFGQSVNLVQQIDDIKHHTERVTNDMKQEIRDTLQAFYMNTNEPPYWNPHTSGVQKTEEETTFHNMLAVQQQQTLTIQQLSKQLLALQTQLNNLTLVNQQMNTGTQIGDMGNNINPTTGQPYKRYCWTCGCCPHWSKIAPKRQRGTKMMQLLRTGWGEAVKIACEDQGRQKEKV